MKIVAEVLRIVRPIGLMGASIVALVAGAGVTAALEWTTSRPALAEKLDGDAPPRDGVEEVAVLIGASWCSASKTPGFAERVPQVFATLRKEARGRGHPFSTMGVSLDWGPVEGISWLTGLAKFDQLVSGRNWTNAAYVQYVLSDPKAHNGVPQLVVIQHHVLRQPRRIEVGRDSVVERLVGPAAIMGRIKLTN